MGCFQSFKNTLVYDSGLEDIDQLKNMARRNFIAFGIHTVLFGISIGFWASGHFPSYYTTKTVTAVWNMSYVNYSQSQLTLSTDQCVQPPKPIMVSWTNSKTWNYQPRLTDSYFLPNGFFILTFITVSLLAHFYRAFFVDYFADMLIQGKPRYDRWLEYGLSSSSMIIIIAAFTGTADAWALTFISVCQSTMCFLGYVIEVADYVETNEVLSVKQTDGPDAPKGGEYDPKPPTPEPSLTPPSDPESNAQVGVRLNMPWRKSSDRVVRFQPIPEYRALRTNAQFDPRMTRLSGDLLGMPSYDLTPIARMMRFMKMLSLFVGFYIFTMIWVSIGWQLFEDYLKIFACLNDQSIYNYTKYPTVIFAVELFLFFTFPLAQIYFNFIRDVKQKLNGFFQEYIYGLLSVTSKAALAGIILAQSWTFQN